MSLETMQVQRAREVVVLNDKNFGLRLAYADSPRRALKTVVFGSEKAEYVSQASR